MDFVCFASAYWDELLWTNKQHIMSNLARRGHRVLYVDPGTSWPALRGWLRGRYPANAAWRWIRPERASAAEVATQVERCPSGALQYRLKNEPRRVLRQPHRM